MMLIVSGMAYADPIEKGKSIFMTRCAACHNVNQKLTGPALAGVHERRSIDWIINFVRSSQTMVKSGDKDAVTLFESFNKVPMPDHQDLTGEDIKQVVEYIKSESKAVVASTAPFAKPRDRKGNAVPLSSSDYGVFGGYLLMVGLLITALVIPVRLKTFQREKQEKSLSA
jgi:cytochrome c551/c552